MILGQVIPELLFWPLILQLTGPSVDGLERWLVVFDVVASPVEPSVTVYGNVSLGASVIRVHHCDMMK